MTIAGYALRESLRRKIFAVVLRADRRLPRALRLGVWRAVQATRELRRPPTAGPRPAGVAGATVFGLAMFATLFLGTVLAVFLTLGAVRGDAERGLLQPLVVRPVGRAQLLAGRFAGAAARSAALRRSASTRPRSLITGVAGGWWPDRARDACARARRARRDRRARCRCSARSSSRRRRTGSRVLMIFGAGLAAGLLAQIGARDPVPTLEHIGRTGLVGPPVRGALPGRSAPPHRRHDRLHAFVLDSAPSAAPARPGRT